jgi:hypothetical protein
MAINGLVAQPDTSKLHGSRNLIGAILASEAPFDPECYLALDDPSARGLSLFPFQSLHLGLSRAISSLPPVAAQLLANRALAHAQHLGNFLLRFSGFPHSIDNLTVFLAEMSVALLLHCFFFPTQR